MIIHKRKNLGTSKNREIRRSTRRVFSCRAPFTYSSSQMLRIGWMATWKNTNNENIDVIVTKQTGGYYG